MVDNSSAKHERPKICACYLQQWGAQLKGCVSTYIQHTLKVEHSHTCRVGTRISEVSMMEWKLFCP